MEETKEMQSSESNNTAEQQQPPILNNEMTSEAPDAGKASFGQKLLIDFAIIGAIALVLLIAVAIGSH